MGDRVLDLVRDAAGDVLPGRHALGGAALALAQRQRLQHPVERQPETADLVSFLEERQRPPGRLGRGRFGARGEHADRARDAPRQDQPDEQRAQGGQGSRPGESEEERAPLVPGVAGRHRDPDSPATVSQRDVIRDHRRRDGGVTRPIHDLTRAIDQGHGLPRDPADLLDQVAADDPSSDEGQGAASERRAPPDEVRHPPVGGEGRKRNGAQHRFTLLEGRQVDVRIASGVGVRERQDGAAGVPDLEVIEPIALGQGEGDRARRRRPLPQRLPIGAIPGEIEGDLRHPRGHVLLLALDEDARLPPRPLQARQRLLAGPSFRLEQRQGQGDAHRDEGDDRHGQDQLRAQRHGG